MLKAHLLWKVTMKYILVTNIEWEKPAAHVICSFMDLSGKASRPIKRCLFIGYIIKTIIKLEDITIPTKYDQG